MNILLTILFKPKLKCQLWYHCQLAFGFQGVIILCDWGTWKPPASLCHHDYHLIQFSLFSCLFSSVPQSCTLFATPWTEAPQTSLSFTISRSLLKLMSFQLVMPSNHLILCCPLLLLPSIFPSIRVFSNELVLCIRWPKYWSFSFNISPSNEYSELISFRLEWFDLLAVQGTLNHLLQQFKSISCLVLSFLYSPALTSIHDYWKKP